MKCFECGGRMDARRANYKDTESGLPNVVLKNVTIRICRQCGEQEVVIPRVEQLHATMANAILNKTSRLTGPEIRFLMKYLGCAGAGRGDCISQP